MSSVRDSSLLSISATVTSQQRQPAHVHHVTGVNETGTGSLLEDLNKEQAILHLPITAFLALLMSFGVAGNACVIYVYRTRFRKTAGSYFIMVLSVLDLVNSGVCLPWEIYDLSNSYFQTEAVLCKMARFITTAVYINAGLVLVCVAFSRYIVLLLLLLVVVVVVFW